MKRLRKTAFEQDALTPWHKVLVERAKSNPTQEMSSSPDNETESCQTSQSGTTSKTSTEHPGEDQLTFFAEDGLAKTYQSQEREQGSKEQGLVFGVSILDSSLKYDHESSSWKTHQCLFNEEVEELSVILGASEDEHARTLRNPNELARRVERCKAIGNGQDAVLAAMAFRILTQGLTL
jgi:hypothetical protein